jgi:hypothetical protein
LSHAYKRPERKARHWWQWWFPGRAEDLFFIVYAFVMFEFILS